jgi:O-antigen ligase
MKPSVKRCMGKSYIHWTSDSKPGIAMSEKPTTAYILSLIGGIFIVIGGLLLAAIGTLIAFLSGFGLILWIFLIFGIIIVIGAVSMNNNPSTTHTWGTVILILGILSLIGVVTALGGLLALIGGAFALSWKPTNPPPQPPPQ